MKKLLFLATAALLMTACGNKKADDPIGDSGRTLRTENLLNNLIVQGDSGVYLFGHQDDTAYGIGWMADYANDSTIFAVSYCSETMSSMVAYQTNIMLVDKDLNLLGRKVLKEDNVLKQVSQPAAFNDDGCLVMVYSYNGNQYPGEPFARYELMKFRREDIEITWDVVNEADAKPMGIAYPNPTTSTINIPVDETLSNDTRIQIFDAKGMKCLDSEVGNMGNLITLDIHNLDAGLYVYKIVAGKRELAGGKFVKE